MAGLLSRSLRVSHHVVRIPVQPASVREPASRTDQVLHLTIFASWLVSVSLIGLVAWIAQTFFQLVLLSALLLGQNLQNEAADARAAKTFKDVEEARNCLRQVLDLLDCHTQGGLKEILDAVEDLKAAR